MQEYIDVSAAAYNWSLSERSVRNYCMEGRISGALRKGKSWLIPTDAAKPSRKQRMSKMPSDILGRLRIEKNEGIKGGIYHHIQIEMTYNSNHIEGSRLSHDQTQYIFETNTIGIGDTAVNVNDIVETVNHFRCIDLVIDNANYMLSESFIKQLHFILKSGTSDSRKSWFAVGQYKNLPNEIGTIETVEPKNVPSAMKSLLASYNESKNKTLKDILDFHYRFERIHPFQDGNGRVGRLIMFKECLKNKIEPIIIDEELKMYYYRGLSEWERSPDYLTDTVLTAQDKFRPVLEYFKLTGS